MDNSRFSTLIYRIIGKPERWHDDYIDVMHQILDETESFDEEDNFSELEAGDRLISQLRGTNAALMAFNTLLNESRFKMIILDESLSPIYHNQNAKPLFDELLVQHPSFSKPQLSPKLKQKIQDVIAQTKQAYSDGKPNSLAAIDATDENGDQLYLRSIYNLSSAIPEGSVFHLLLLLDKERQRSALNGELIARYDLTDKEQNVLIRLIHGQSIKQIAEESFVTENTVKTHLKGLFRKTETKSQTDVVRLILTHESQILDSYFDPSKGLMNQNAISTPDEMLTLHDGSKLAYCDYGPKDGDVVIVCHNGYGCRLSVPLGYNEVCQKHQKRVIIFDRPGTGLSPFERGHPESWHAKLREAIDILGIQRYEVLGSVLGTVFALLHAVEADERLTRVRIAGPVFVNSKKDTEHLIGIFAPSVRLVRASKRFAREIYELWLKSITLNLATHYRKMIDNSLGTAERALLTQQGNLEQTIDLLVDGFREGSARSISGISHDMVYCLSPRKVDLSKIKVPVDIWYGAEDTRVSLAGAENLAAQLPHAKLHIRDGYSEHIYYTLFEEILASTPS